MHKLSTFSLHDMMDLRGQLRSLLESEASTIEEAASRAVGLFRSELLDGEGRPAFALARVYKTHRFLELDEELQAYARMLEPAADSLPDLRCLVLLATAGDEPAWNDRRLSSGHRAIPLSSEAAVEKAPMIASLIKQLDLDVATVLRPGRDLFLDAGETNHNVFYVPEALGSPFIVAQEEFVKPYAIRSVIGFGGMVATGDLFAGVLFSKVHVPADVADLFRVLGLNFKLAMLPVARKPLFSARPR